jgi:MerR family mercuric resistance operon transcriptional regulator
MQDGLAIGELARRLGVNIETIRYYERAGLVPPPGRTPGGRRRYSESEVQTLAFIRKARALGFHLDDTRALLRLRGPDNACSDVSQIAQRHLEKVRADLRRTTEVERILAQAVAQCRGGTTRACPVLKILENAG